MPSRPDACRSLGRVPGVCRRAEDAHQGDLLCRRRRQAALLRGSVPRDYRIRRHLLVPPVEQRRRGARLQRGRVPHVGHIEPWHRGHLHGRLGLQQQVLSGFGHAWRRAAHLLRDVSRPLPYHSRGADRHNAGERHRRGSDRRVELAHLQGTHPGNHRLPRVPRGWQRRGQPWPVRLGRGRERAYSRLPHRVFGYGLRLLLPRRVPQPLRRCRHRLYSVPRRLGTVQHRRGRR